MNNLLEANIFFFVTTVAVIAVTLVLVIAGAYAIKVLRDLTYITKKAKEKSDDILKDIDDLRSSIKNQDLKTKIVGTFFKKIFQRSTKKKSSW